MTPEQFLDQLQKKGPEPVYLFLGPESFNRDRVPPSSDRKSP